MGSDSDSERSASLVGGEDAELAEGDGDSAATLATTLAAAAGGRAGRLLACSGA